MRPAPPAAAARRAPRDPRPRQKRISARYSIAEEPTRARAGPMALQANRHRLQARCRRRTAACSLQGAPTSRRANARASIRPCSRQARRDAPPSAGSRVDRPERSAPGTNNGGPCRPSCRIMWRRYMRHQTEACPQPKKIPKVVTTCSNRLPEHANPLIGLTQPRRKLAENRPSNCASWAGRPSRRRTHRAVPKSLPIRSARPDARA